jgi:hypothetical protein
MLLVLGQKDDGKVREKRFPDEDTGLEIDADWQVEFHPFKGEIFSMESDELFAFGGHEDPRIAAFAGQVSYQATFDLKETGWAFLDLGMEEHITEVKINGTNAGVKWWGRHLYELAPGMLQEGENQLEILYTTTLANYASSLTGNEVARRWIRLEEPDRMGLTGDIKLLKSI